MVAVCDASEWGIINGAAGPTKQDPALHSTVGPEPEALLWWFPGSPVGGSAGGGTQAFFRRSNDHPIAAQGIIMVG